MVFAVAVWTLARRQRPLKPALLQRFQTKCELLRREPGLCSGIGLVSSTEDATMRWRIRQGNHDPRQIDLLAALALVIAIIAVDHYFGHRQQPPATSAFIEPSQTVRW